MVAICDTFVGKLRAHCYAGAMTIIQSLKKEGVKHKLLIRGQSTRVTLECLYGKEATKHISMLMQQHTEIKKQQAEKRGAIIFCSSKYD